MPSFEAINSGGYTVSGDRCPLCGTHCICVKTPRGEVVTEIDCIHHEIWNGEHVFNSEEARLAAIYASNSPSEVEAFLWGGHDASVHVRGKYVGRFSVTAINNARRAAGVPIDE